MASSQSSESANIRLTGWFWFAKSDTIPNERLKKNIMDRLTVILNDREEEITKIRVRPFIGHKIPFPELMDNIVHRYKVPYAAWLRKKGGSDWKENHEPTPGRSTGISWHEYCKWIGPFIYQAEENLQHFVNDAIGAGYVKPYREKLGEPGNPADDDSHVNEVKSLAGALKSGADGQETLAGRVMGWHQPSSSFQ